MRVGFTGTQEGTTFKQRRSFVDWLSERPEVDEFHHGDCVGSDAEAHDIVAIFKQHRKSIEVHVHPCTIKSKRAFKKGDREYPVEPPLVRNRHIVNRVDVLVATPKGFEEELRSGTWSTIRCARKRGIPIFIIWPDGRIEHERPTTTESIPTR